MVAFSPPGPAGRLFVRPPLYSSTQAMVEMGRLLVGLGYLERAYSASARSMRLRLPTVATGGNSL